MVAELRRGGSLKITLSAPNLLLFALLAACASSPDRSSPPNEIAPRDGSLVLAFGGDVVLGRWINGPEGSIWRENSQELPDEARGILLDADLTIVNLETALCDHEIADQARPHLLRQPFRLTAPPRAADRLVDWGVDVAVVANNHAMDCGLGSLRSTARALREREILPAGIWRRGGSFPGEPIVLDLDTTTDEPQRIVITAITTHPAPIDLLDQPAPDLGPATLYNWHENLAALSEHISALRAEHGDRALLIVSLHWGQEGSPEPLDRQRYAAKELFQAGADVLFGHGPHRTHEAAILDGSAILYSAGDLLFDGLPDPTPGLFTLRASPPNGDTSRWTMEILSRP